MTLAELQTAVASWASRNFGDRESWQPLVGAMEELGELSHAHLKATQGIRLDENHTAGAKDAIGDIVVYLADYCNLRGFDMQDIVDETWREVSKRRFPKGDVEGYENHTELRVNGRGRRRPAR